MNVEMFNRIEAFIRKMAVLLLIATLIFQVLMQIDSVRYALSTVEKYEGKQYVFQLKK